MTISEIVTGVDPQTFLSHLNNVDEGDIQNLFNAAISYSLKYNREVDNKYKQCNIAKKIYYKILYTLSCGYYNPFKTISIIHVESNIEKIQEAIRSTPLNRQTWRTNEDLNRNLAAQKIQKAWRGNIRRKIQADKSTYEKWRIEAVNCSEPYGKPTNTQSPHIIQDHQINKRARYQFRLLTSQLGQAKGVRTFAFNHVATDRNKEYDAKVQSYAKLFFAYTLLFNLKRNSPNEIMQVIKILRENKKFIDYETIEYLIRIKRSVLSNFVILALRETLK